jgi:hypothetical protein
MRYKTDWKNETLRRWLVFARLLTMNPSDATAPQGRADV